MNRPRDTFLQCFCPFLLLFLGCTSGRVDLFFDKYEVRESRVGTKVHRAEKFPRSIPIEGVKRNLLLAGTRDHLSFFVEYYELESDPPKKDKVTKGLDWYQDPNGTYFHEREISILNEEHLEIRFFRRYPPYILYGSFLIQTASKIEFAQLMPELYETE